MALTDAHFRSLSARIAELVGIHITIEKRWLLAARVKERLAHTGDRDEGLYVERVLDTKGAEELGQLVEALRVGETQFFRHAGQLQAVRRVALPEIIARRERDGTGVVKVWSAGCASGEEPYTLAMLLDAELSARPRVRYEILATDLSERALATAARGRYPKGAGAKVPADIGERAFAGEGDELLISPRLRQHVRFEQKNLLDARYPQGFDLVFCRNVLIYFGRATQREVMGRLCRSVVPGGYLALGYSERLDAGDGELLPLRTDDGMLYRRADGATRVVVPREAPHRAAPRTTARTATRPGSETATATRPGSETATATRSGSETETETETETKTGTETATAFSGELFGPAGVARARAALAPLLAGDQPAPRLDLSALEYADAEVGRLLARAAAACAAHGEALRISGASRSVRRFLARHHVVPPAILEEADA